MLGNLYAFYSFHQVTCNYAHTHLLFGFMSLVLWLRWCFEVSGTTWVSVICLIPGSSMTVHAFGHSGDSV